jgi:hypothetical protein
VLARESVAGQRHRRDVATQGQRQRIDTELDPADRGCRKQRALLAAETVDGVIDDGGQVLGNRHRREAGRGGSVRVRAFQHLGDDRRDEQRHAVGTLVQRTHEGLVAGERRRMLRDAGGDLGLGERVEPDLLAQAMQAELAPQRVERMIRRHHLGDAEGGEPHQAGADAPPRDVVDELDRRSVAPVQVFSHQQQWTMLRVAVQQLAHLAQHAVGADTGELAAKRLSLFHSAEPGQLQQPSRRHTAQQPGQLPVAARQLGQRLQHRKIRLACAVVLDALTARDGRAMHAAHKVLDQHRLADSRLAGYPHHRALALARVIPGALQPCDRVGAADKRWCRARQGERPDHRHRRRRRRRCRHRDEAIAPPGYRLDEAGLARAVAQGIAQIADGGLEHRFGHELVTPYRVEQRVLGQEGARMACQRAQQAEGGRRERNGLSVAQ